MHGRIAFASLQSALRAGGIGFVRLVAELRRRRVFRAIAWYTGGALVVVQTASAVFAPLGFTESALRLVIVASIVGLPVVGVLSWFFDLTPDGSAPEVQQENPLRSASLWLALGGGVLLGVGAYHGWRTLVPATDDAPRSLAVLPLVDLDSPDTPDALVGGLHEELTSQLAGIRALRVTSRTSTLAYKPGQEARQIAAALGVGYLLEGSVRRSRDRVRVTLQLIDATRDSHLWAQSYDRALGDVFELEAEITRDVARNLAARLDVDEESRLAGRSPVPFSAYAGYLRAAETINRFRGGDLNTLDQAIDSLRVCISEAPDFSRAHAALARALTWRARDTGDASMLAEARAAVERAEALAPNAPETLHARAQLIYRGEQRYQDAQVAFARLFALAPSFSSAMFDYSFLLFRTGKWDEGLAVSQRALELDPNDMARQSTHIQMQLMCHRYPQAREMSNRLLSRLHGDREAFALAKTLEYLASGDPAALEAALQGGGLVEDEISGVNAAWRVAMLRGRLDDALEIATKFDEQLNASGNGGSTTEGLRMLRATTLSVVGEDGARDAAAAPFVAFVEAQHRADPGRLIRRASLGLVRALAGDREGSRHELAAYDQAAAASHDGYELARADRLRLEASCVNADWDDAVRLLGSALRRCSTVQAPTIMHVSACWPLAERPEVTAMGVNPPPAEFMAALRERQAAGKVR